MPRDVFDIIGVEVKKPDVFDLLTKDIFDQISADVLKDIKKELPGLLKKYIPPERTIVKISDEVVKAIKNEISSRIQSIQPKVIEKIVEKKVVEKTPEKIVIKEMLKMGDVENKIDEKIKDLKKKVYDKINHDIEEKSRILIAPSPLPSMHHQQGKILSNDGSNAKWIEHVSTSSGSGADLSAYTITNNSELRILDAADTSMDELANILGTLIEDLKAGYKPTYVVTNETTDRDLDSSDTSLDELSNVLGTLIKDLQAKGLLT